MIRASFLLAFTALFLAISSCNNSKKEASKDEDFLHLIRAYTAGLVERNASIRIVFQDNVLLPEEQRPIEGVKLKIEPPLSGTLQWIGDNTLEFRPEQTMPVGTAFIAELQLDGIIENEHAKKPFVFGWRSFDMAGSLEISQIETYQADRSDWVFLAGIMNTTDVLLPEELEDIMTAKQGNRNLPLRWSTLGNNSYRFEVDSVQRSISRSSVQFQWDQSFIDLRRNGSFTQEIPGLEDFDVINTRVVQDPDQHLVILFSDPLDPHQALEGHFLLNGSDQLNPVLAGNAVHLYPENRLTGSVLVEIRNSLRSASGYPLKGDYSAEVLFEQLKPEVRISDANKTILPPGNENSFSFEAVGLKAVDVRVIRIAENNLFQFLQVNALDGDNELKRVGRVVKRKTVNLQVPQGSDLGRWNKHFLNLNDFVNAEQGALYRVEIGFRKSQSLYPCDEPADTERIDSDNSDQDEDWNSSGEEENSYWDYFDNWYYNAWDNDYNYNWRERDNPCHVAYYQQHRFASRNLLASNLGLVAKRGEGKNWHAWVNDLSSAQAVANASLRFYNYQGEVIHESKTDSEGSVHWNEEAVRPFLIIADYQGQQAYLRVQGGEQLSYARFDVAGASTNDGMKGFIYGERGVWRPGDTLHLGFILEEAQGLPASHPVRLVLKDSRGRLHSEHTKALGEHQHLAWRLPTRSDDPTGSWHAQVHIGSTVFTKWLRVETIKPNRLKIDLTFDDDVLSPEMGSNRPSGELSVEWLHGAPGKNLRAVVEMGLKSTNTRFVGFENFVFDDPSRRLEVEASQVFDANLDDKGKAVVFLPFQEVSDAPGMLKATFNTRAYEAGGDFSIDQMSIPYSPYSNYVGLRLPKGDKSRGMLLTDTTHTVHVQSLNAKGQKAGARQLEYTVYKVEWRWWWENGQGDLNSYNGRRQWEVVQSGQVRTNAQGEGSFGLRVDYPQWGRYLVRVEDLEGGHAAGQTVYLDWPGWAGRPQREDPGAASILSLSLNKETYAPGETAVLSIPGAKQARALLTLENGSGVVDAQWVELKEGNNEVRIPIRAEFAPTVYANVLMLQAHAQTANDHPMRMYGVVRIPVEDPASRLHPVVQTAQSYEPEAPYEITVSESEGKAMTYTLAVVDEGLLGLTRFQTPDPHGHFYAQEALGVETWDLYDEVIGAYGLEWKQSLLTGGDADGGLAKGKREVNRFKPVVEFIGPFHLPVGSKRTHRFTMPNYVGAVRLMVVARDADAYGASEQSIPVKKPLMVLSTLPRVLVPGERITVPVNVFAMDAKIKNVAASISFSEHFKLIGTAKQEVRFSQVGDQLVNFELEVLDAVGAANIRVEVEGHGEGASHEVDLQVRNPNPYVNQHHELTLEPNKDGSLSFDLPGTDGSNELTLEVSSFGRLSIGHRMNYLIGYPHGCLEQTVSKAFPQLYLADAVQLSKEEEQRSKDYVAAAVRKLQRFQQSNGSFSYWPGRSTYSDWSNTYAGHFLLEARSKGFAVSEALLQQWLSQQATAARGWRHSSTSGSQGDELLQAYRLYSLALAGKAELGAMNRLREQNELSTTARWQLAAAYLLAGKNQAAEALMAGPNDFNPGTNDNSFGTYHRNRAIYAEALMLVNRRGEALPLVRELMERLNGQDWLSTQESAFLLMAVGKFLKDEPASPANFTYKLNTKSGQEATASKGVWSRKLPVDKLSNNQLQLSNTSQRTLYVRVIARGQAKEDQLDAESKGLSLSLRYQNDQGEDIDISRIEQGSDFVCAVTIRGRAARKHYPYLALTQVFPSGWELLNERMLEVAGQANTNSPSDYRDLRDDRVMTYFDLQGDNAVTYYLRFNAAYLGRFFLPAAQVEMMYDGSIHARSKGQWVEVVRPGIL